MDTAEIENSPAHIEGDIPNEILRILSDVDQLRLLYKFLCEARLTSPFGPERTPGRLLETIRERGLWHVSPQGIQASPDTESFRRHILVGKAGVIELKVPGDHGRKRCVWKEGFHLPNTFIETFGPELMTRTLGFVSHSRGEFEAYGENIRFPENTGYPFNVAAYDFNPEAGCRVANINGVWARYLVDRYQIVDDVRGLTRTLWSQMFRYIVRAHFLGFGGKPPDGGSDLHVENFRVILGERALSIQHVGDLESYSCAFLQPSTVHAQVARDIRDFVSGGEVSQHDFKQLDAANNPISVSTAEMIYEENLREAQPELEDAHKKTINKQAELDAMLKANDGFRSREERLHALRKKRDRDRLIKVQEKLLKGVF